MNLWLFYLIFGNGYGLAARDHDTSWYILSGRAYHWIGGHGAQLCSFEWRPPRVGEYRVLAGVKFRPFSFSRRWFLYDVSWCADEFSGSIDHSITAIRAFRKKLGEL